MLELMKPMRLMGLVGLVGLMALAGCSSDAAEQDMPTGNGPTAASVEVMSYVAGFEENTTLTRSWTPPTGYSLYDEDDKAIGIGFTQNGKEPLSGFFFKSSGKWRTSVELADAGTYYLYGYIPHTSGISSTITDRYGANANYSEGAKVTLTNVPAIMPNDLCVVIGAKDGTGKETVDGLRSGSFAYNAKAIKADDDEAAGNFVFLLFDHLYAAVRIRMRVHDDYNTLRTIKLKSLQLSTKASETTSKVKTDIAIELKKTDGSTPGESPIVGITYTPRGENIDGGLEFWSSTAGETMTTEYSTHIGHFMPQDITTLILTSIYDVYDKQGNLIRQDCKATNTMTLSELLTGQATTRRGCRYTINMTIKPTYIYMLSEPDLNNPEVTIE